MTAIGRCILLEQCRLIIVMGPQCILYCKLLIKLALVNIVQVNVRCIVLSVRWYHG